MQGAPVRRVSSLRGLLHRGNTAATIYVMVMACGAAGPATAAAIDASATVASDYRSRGVSLSDRQPVAGATVALTAAAGWFAGAEAVSNARPRNLRLARGRDAEVDLTAGWSKTIGLLTPSAGVIAYLYPSHGPAEVEAFGSVAGALGPATVTLGLNYAPDQAGARGGNLYTYARAAFGIPLTPATITASVGREAGAFDLGLTKVDYRIGVEAKVWKLTVGARYVGNDVPKSFASLIRHATADTVVGSVAVAF